MAGWLRISKAIISGKSHCKVQAIYNKDVLLQLKG